MHRLMLISLAASVCLSLAMADTTEGQKPARLPEPCGGADRQIAEFNLQQYRSIFFAEDHEQLRSGLGVRQLTSDEAVQIVDKPRLCNRLIRRVVELLNGQVWEAPGHPSERVRRTGIHYEFFRYGPYLVALVTTPEDPDVAFIGRGTLLVFEEDGLRFVDSFQG